MRRFPWGTLLGAAAAALALPPARAGAQTPGRPTVVLSIFGGVQTGHALWTVGRQPLCVLDPQNQCTPQYDTLRLSRSAAATLVAGLTAVYFPRPGLGFHAQLGYQGFPLDDDCRVLSPNPDARNEQVCSSIRRSGVTGGSVSALAGVVLRAAADRGVSPFLRVGVGIVSRPQSSMEMRGDFNDGTSTAQRVVIVDDSPRRTWASGLLGIGLTTSLGPGYQFRLELRDLVSRVERPTGPADDGGRAPAAARVTHSVALQLALDIVLEQRRGRRY